MQLSATASATLKRVLLENGVRRAGIFGSYARNEADAESDLDLLIELDDAASLLDVIRLKHTLEDALQIPVDLVEYKAIKPILKNEILTDEISIL